MHKVTHTCILNFRLIRIAQSSSNLHSNSPKTHSSIKKTSLSQNQIDTSHISPTTQNSRSSKLFFLIPLEDTCSSQQKSKKRLANKRQKISKFIFSSVLITSLRLSLGVGLLFAEEEKKTHTKVVQSIFISGDKC